MPPATIHPGTYFCGALFTARFAPRCCIPSEVLWLFQSMYQRVSTNAHVCTYDQSFLVYSGMELFCRIIFYATMFSATSSAQLCAELCAQSIFLCVYGLCSSTILLTILLFNVCVLCSICWPGSALVCTTHVSSTLYCKTTLCRRSHWYARCR